jgi:glycosyltransferase involved in cell wall biosynthesis
MKVLFLTTSYPTAAAPVAGIFVREHALAVRNACDVVVVHLDRADGVRGLVRLRHEPDKHPPVWRARFPRRPRPLSALGLVVSALLAYRRAVRTFDPDVIHAHFFLAGLPAVLIGALYRKPVVITEHWSVFLREDPARLSPLLKLGARIAFGRAALVLPASTALERGIAALGLRSRSRVVPNAVDASLFHPDGPRRTEGLRRLLTVSLLYDAKGHDILLEALARLALDRADFHLDIVGDGPLRQELEEQARRLGIERFVTFAGLKSKAEIADLMRAADLFVLASRFDNNPSVLIEAAASGLPTVATRVGGIPEIVGDGGVLVDPASPDQFAKGIATALDRLGAFDRDGIVSRARARYSSDAVGAALLEAYRDAVCTRSAAGQAPSILGRRWSS